MAQVREALKPFTSMTSRSSNRSKAAKLISPSASPINTSEAIEKQVMQIIVRAATSRWSAQERVGALVGGELAKNSLWALGIGILGILIFVTLRFELSFAVGANRRPAPRRADHGRMFSLLGRELTLTMVGAVLTIAGYSINDTIVVYDRIREGLASGRKGSIEQS